MAPLISTITSKGQTTVPQAIRAALKVKPRQRLAWAVQADGSAVVRPQTSALALFGSLKAPKRFRGRDPERQATMRAIARHAAREGLE